MAIVEAAAVGLLVVSTRVGGVPEVRGLIVCKQQFLACLPVCDRSAARLPSTSAGAAAHPTQDAPPPPACTLPLRCQQVFPPDIMLLAEPSPEAPTPAPPQKTQIKDKLSCLRTASSHCPCRCSPLI
jgi:hypothetical protein